MNIQFKEGDNIIPIVMVFSIINKIVLAYKMTLPLYPALFKDYTFAERRDGKNILSHGFQSSFSLLMKFNTTESTNEKALMMYSLKEYKHNTFAQYMNLSHFDTNCSFIML